MLLVQREAKEQTSPQKAIGEDFVPDEDFQTTVRLLKKHFKTNHLAFTQRSTQNQIKN